MAKNLKPREKARNAYYQALGETIGAWADLEETLGHWFCAVAEIRRDTGILIFYSGRNFSTRADMLSAALKKARVTRVETELVKAGLKVALRYSGFRNVIAHHTHFERYGVGMMADTPKNYVGLDPTDRPYTMQDMQQATANFLKLDELLSGVDLEYESEEGWQARHLAQVLQLPLEAYSSEPPPTPTIRKPRAKPQSH